MILILVTHANGFYEENEHGVDKMNTTFLLNWCKLKPLYRLTFGSYLCFSLLASIGHAGNVSSDSADRVLADVFNADFYISSPIEELRHFTRNSNLSEADSIALADMLANCLNSPSNFCMNRRSESNWGEFESALKNELYSLIKKSHNFHPADTSLFKTNEQLTEGLPTNSSLRFMTVLQKLSRGEDLLPAEKVVRRTLKGTALHLTLGGTRKRRNSEDPLFRDPNLIFLALVHYPKMAAMSEGFSPDDIVSILASDNIGDRTKGEIRTALFSESPRTVLKILKETKYPIEFVSSLSGEQLDLLRSEVKNPNSDTKANNLFSSLANALELLSPHRNNKQNKENVHLLAEAIIGEALGSLPDLQKEVNSCQALDRIVFTEASEGLLKMQDKRHYIQTVLLDFISYLNKKKILNSLNHVDLIRIAQMVSQMEDCLLDANSGYDEMTRRAALDSIAASIDGVFAICTVLANHSKFMDECIQIYQTLRFSTDQEVALLKSISRIVIANAERCSTNENSGGGVGVARTVYDFQKIALALHSSTHPPSSGEQEHRCHQIRSITHREKMRSEKNGSTLGPDHLRDLSAVKKIESTTAGE